MERDSSETPARASSEVGEIMRSARWAANTLERALGILWTHKALTAVTIVLILPFALAQGERSVVVVENIGVPKKWEEDGLPATVVSESVRTALLRIELSSTADTRNRKPASLRGADEKNPIQVEVAGAKIDLGYAVQRARELLGGKTIRVTSYVRDNDGTIEAVVNVYEPSTAPVQQTIVVEEPAQVGAQIAERILAILKPAALAEYFYREQDNLGRAEPVLAECERTAAPDRKAECLIVRGDIELDASNIERAAEYYHRASAWNRHSAEALASLAWLAFQEGDTGGARAQLEEALRLDPSSLQARYQLAWLMLRTGNLTRAKAEAERAVKLAPKSPATLSLLAETLAVGGDRDRAFDLIKEALAYDPQSHAPLIAKARYFVQQGAHEEAAKMWQAASHRNGPAAHVYNEWGNLLFELGDHVGALARYGQAIDARGEDYLFYVGRGRALKELRRFEDAHTAFDQALQFNPRSSLVRVNRALLLEAEGRPAEAEAEWKRIGVMGTSYHVIHLAGWLLPRDPAKAVSIFADAVKREPWNVVMRVNFANLLASAGQYDEALREMSIANAWAPTNRYVLGESGRLLAAIGRPHAAEALWTLALQTNPHSAAIHEMRAAALFMRGEVATAITAYQEAVKSNPFKAALQDALGIAYLRDARTAEAAQCFLNALELRGIPLSLFDKGADDF